MSAHYLKGEQYNKRVIFPPDHVAERRDENNWLVNTELGIRELSVLKGLIQLPDGILMDCMHSFFLGAFKYQIEAMFTYSLAAYLFFTAN